MRRPRSEAGARARSQRVLPGVHFPRRRAGGRRASGYVRERSNDTAPLSSFVTQRGSVIFDKRPTPILESNHQSLYAIAGPITEA
jgi:hypothetical protein